MADIKINFWTLTFLISSAQGVFLAIVLLTRKQKSSANYFLSALVLLFSITLVFYVFFWSGLANRLGFFFGFVLKFVLLLGPLAYLYVKSIMGEKIRPSNLRHFYAFLGASLASLIPVYNLNGILNQYMPYIECASLVFYSLLILNANRKPVQKERLRVFIKQFALMFMGFTLSYISYYFLTFSGLLKREYDYGISMMMALFIYFIGYRGYFLSEITTGNYTNNEKYEKSGLTDATRKYYADKLNEAMINEQLFVNNNLKLATLADQLQISSHHLSEIINSSFNQSFSDFVNRFRVEKAIEMLNSPDHESESLIGIAYACGFNNKVSFNNAFRKVTGIPPGYYRKLNLEERLLKSKTKGLPAEV